MKITKRQLRRIIREEVSRETDIQGAYQSGIDDAREGYDPGSYHDWIEGDQELMDLYDEGFKAGLMDKPEPSRRRWSKDAHKDMDIGTRGLPGVHGVD